MVALNVWSFVTRFFLLPRFQSYSMLHVPMFHVFFFWLNNIPLYQDISPSDGHLGFFYLGAIMNNAAMILVYQLLCGHSFQFFLSIIPFLS